MIHGDKPQPGIGDDSRGAGAEEDVPVAKTKVGDRVRLLDLRDPYSTRSPGDTGTVEAIKEIPPEITPSEELERQIWVKWDTGGMMALIPEAGDRYELIDSE